MSWFLLGSQRGNCNWMFLFMDKRQKSCLFEYHVHIVREIELYKNVKLNPFNFCVHFKSQLNTNMLSCELEKENQICHGREPLLGVVDTTFNSSLLHILLGFHKKKKKVVWPVNLSRATDTCFIGGMSFFFLFRIFILGNKTSSTTTKQSPLKKKRRRKKERLQLQYWSVGNRVPARVVVGGTPLTRFDCLLWCLPLVAQLHSCVDLGCCCRQLCPTCLYILRHAGSNMKNKLRWKVISFFVSHRFFFKEYFISWIDII